MTIDAVKGIFMPTKARKFVARIKVPALLALLSCSVAQADNVADSDEMLCSVSRVLLCVEDGNCFPISVLDLDIPQFLLVDTKKKTISTTAASGENRVSNVANLVRDAGRTFLQGIELNRAYSILIEDDIGRFTAVVARDGISVSAFGACTDADVE